VTRGNPSAKVHLDYLESGARPRPRFKETVNPEFKAKTVEIRRKRKEVGTIKSGTSVYR
jgi:hypothetical protein